MKTFFIADTHFFDDTIRRYENRPFETALQMNEKLIENWNSVVGDDDQVFVLGDVSAGTQQQDKELISSLKGKKFLVLGNHDLHRSLEEWRNIGFEQVYDYPIIYKGFFILSHEPLYVCRNMPYANIFGHVHDNPSYKDASEQSACVCVERIGYTPIEFAPLLAIIKGEKKEEQN